MKPLARSVPVRSAPEIPHCYFSLDHLNVFLFAPDAHSPYGKEKKQKKRASLSQTPSGRDYSLVLLMSVTAGQPARGGPASAMRETASRFASSIWSTARGLGYPGAVAGNGCGAGTASAIGSEAHGVVVVAVVVAVVVVVVVVVVVAHGERPSKGAAAGSRAGGGAEGGAGGLEASAPTTTGTRAPIAAPATIAGGPTLTPAGLEGLTGGHRGCLALSSSESAGDFSPSSRVHGARSFAGPSLCLSRLFFFFRGFCTAGVAMLELS